MNSLRIIIAAFIILICALSVKADVTEALQGVKKEIKKKKLLLNKTQKVETQVSKDLGRIEKSLHEKEAGLAAFSRDLKAVEIQLSRTQREADIVREDAVRKQQQIKVRLSALYKAGEIGSARMFFSSESFPQMVENIRLMRSIVENDKRLFAEYNEKINRLNQLKSKLERDVLRREKIKTSMEFKKLEIESERKKKALYLLQVKADKKTYLASIKELEANARRLQVMVEKLEAKSRKGYTKSHKQGSIVGSPALPAVPDKGFGSLKGHLSMPAQGEIIGGFGRHKHTEFNSYTVSNGISIAAPAGSDIHSVYDGQVIFSDYFKGYGNMVIVDHGGGFFSLYAHASRILKKVGSNVGRNETVASVGDTDSIRGPMLYFEIRYQGKPVDPAPWFR